VHYEHVVSTNVRIVRDYYGGNYERIKAELQKIDWDHEFASDLDTSWNKFKHILLDLESKYVPIKKLKNSGRMKKPIWMSHKALNCVRKNRVFRKYKGKDHPAVKKCQ